MYLLNKLQILSKIRVKNVRYLYRLGKCAPIVNLIPKSINVIPQTRTNSILKRFRKPTEEKYKKMDGIFEHYNLIYRTTLGNYLFGAQAVSLLSGVSLLIGCFLFIGDEPLQSEGIYPVPDVDRDLAIYVTSIGILLLSMQALLLRMPIRVYHAPQTKQYIFVHYGRLPFTRTKYTAKQGTIYKMPASGFLPWNDSRYAVGSRGGIILHESQFKTSSDINIMLGLESDD